MGWVSIQNKIRTHGIILQKEQKKRYVKNIAEINWNTEYKWEAYKYTIKMIAKITSGWIADD